MSVTESTYYPNANINKGLARQKAKIVAIGLGLTAFIAIVILGVMHGINSGNLGETAAICGPLAVAGGATVGITSLELVYKCIRSCQHDRPLSQ